MKGKLETLTDVNRTVSINLCVLFKKSPVCNCVLLFKYYRTKYTAIIISINWNKDSCSKSCLWVVNVLDRKPITMHEGFNCLAGEYTTTLKCGQLCNTPSLYTGGFKRTTLLNKRSTVSVKRYTISRKRSTMQAEGIKFQWKRTQRSIWVFCSWKPATHLD